MTIGPYPVFDTDENCKPTKQIAWVTPAKPEDVQRLLSLPVTDGDTRSDFFWMRLYDGTLLLGVYPQGDTYMQFSDGGVCDWENA